MRLCIFFSESSCLRAKKNARPSSLCASRSPENPQSQAGFSLSYPWCLILIQFSPVLMPSMSSVCIPCRRCVSCLWYYMLMKYVEEKKRRRRTGTWKKCYSGLASLTCLQKGPLHMIFDDICIPKSRETRILESMFGELVLGCVKAKF